MADHIDRCAELADKLTKLDETIGKIIRVVAGSAPEFKATVYSLANIAYGVGLLNAELATLSGLPPPKSDDRWAP